MPHSRDSLQAQIIEPGEYWIFAKAMNNITSMPVCQSLITFMLAKAFNLQYTDPPPP